MQTDLAEFIRDTPVGREADSILRKCVHCGFCTATCPTYGLLGDELDSPRGRIYLIKQVLEGQEVTRRTRLHLDRCLTCRSCETTCPSGVRYGRLVDIGREVVEERVPRSAPERGLRRMLRLVLAHRSRFTPLLRLGQTFAPLLPPGLKRKVPPRQEPGPVPEARHARRMLLLEGCVQPAMAPRINAATRRVFDRLGVSLVSAPAAGCCGAVSYHLSAPGEALDFMRRNIDAWWPHIERGAEGIVISASACAGMVKDYGELLAADPEYAERAARVSALTLDLSEALADQDPGILGEAVDEDRRVAFHAPCTLQHGQKLAGKVEALLSGLGVRLTPVPDAHLCCGSAGTYSILQPDLSGRLLESKVAALSSGEPDLIATANIGCLAHLQTEAQVPVVHWIELLDRETAPPA